MYLVIQNNVFQIYSFVNYSGTGYSEGAKKKKKNLSEIEIKVFNVKKSAKNSVQHLNLP